MLKHDKDSVLSRDDDFDFDDDDDGDDNLDPSIKYSEKIRETLNEDGIEYDLWTIPLPLLPTLTTTTDGETKETSSSKKETTKWNHHQHQYHLDTIRTVIHQANEDDSIDGILVFYPIFDNDHGHDHDHGRANSPKETSTSMIPISKSSSPGVYYKTLDDVVRSMVTPTKDVEGLCSTSKWFTSSSSSSLTKTSTKSSSSKLSSTKSKQIKLHQLSTITTDDDDDDKDGGIFIDTEIDTDGDVIKQQQQVVFPCTALSVLKILEEYHIFNNNNNNSNINDSKDDVISCRHRYPHRHQQEDNDTTTNNNNNDKNKSGGEKTVDWKDTVVSIVNRSEIMGRPLATMLSSLGAKTVYSIDENSILEFFPVITTRKVDNNSKNCNSTSSDDDNEDNNNIDNNQSCNEDPKSLRRSTTAYRHRVHYMRSSMSSNEKPTMDKPPSNEIPVGQEEEEEEDESCYDTCVRRCLERSNIIVTGVPSPTFQLPIDYLLKKRKKRTNGDDGRRVTIVNVSEYPNIDIDELLLRQQPRQDDDDENDRSSSSSSSSGGVGGGDILYVPLVGKVTVACLEHNLVQLYANNYIQRRRRRREGEAGD